MHGRPKTRPCPVVYPRTQQCTKVRRSCYSLPGLSSQLLEILIPSRGTCARSSTHLDLFSDLQQGHLHLVSSASPHLLPSSASPSLTARNNVSGWIHTLVADVLHLPSRPPDLAAAVFATSTFPLYTSTLGRQQQRPSAARPNPPQTILVCNTSHGYHEPTVPEPRPLRCYTRCYHLR